MNIILKIKRRIARLLSQMLISVFIIPKKIKYSLLSNNKIIGKFRAYSPILSLGDGLIKLNNVSFGVMQSPKFFSSYGYLEARKSGSKIIIGENTFINNNVYICAEQTIIEIGRDCLIGVNFSCIDSDFHGIHPDKRRGGHQVCKPVNIGKNVFIGNNVSILKGVTIGDNSVVASNSVVTKSFNSNVVIAGNPARVIKEFSLDES